MSGENLLKTYPNAAKVVKEWFMNQMIVSMASDNITPDEFKQAMIDEGISDERLGTLIDIQPRTFFDVMDLNNMVIRIIPIKEKDPVKFLCKVNGFEDPYEFDAPYFNRKDAEKTGLETAFHLLEEHITGNLNFEQLNKEEENEIK